MDHSPDKKSRKQSKDSDSKKKPASSSHRNDYPQHENRVSIPSSSSHPNNSGPSDPGMQRRHHWETILEPPSHPTNSLDPSHPSPFNRSSPASDITYPNSPSVQTIRRPSSHTRYRHHPVRTPPRAVPIAPSGPIVERREDNDGFRFKCTEEGCEQKFRHRSSRSRHKKNCHMRKKHNSN